MRVQHFFLNLVILIVKVYIEFFSQQELTNYFIQPLQVEDSSVKCVNPFDLQFLPSFSTFLGMNAIVVVFYLGII